MLEGRIEEGVLVEGGLVTVGVVVVGRRVLVVEVEVEMVEFTEDKGLLVPREEGAGELPTLEVRQVESAEGRQV